MVRGHPHGCPHWIPSLHGSNLDRESGVRRQGSQLSCFSFYISHEAHAREGRCLGPFGHEGHTWQREPHVEQAWLTPLASVRGPGCKGPELHRHPEMPVFLAPEEEQTPGCTVAQG